MRGLAALALVLAAGPAFAHERGWTGQPAWSWDGLVLALLAVSGALYTLGVGRLWVRAGRGRGASEGQAACFAAAWGLLVLALVSPLHELGRRLFTAHMLEHEILMTLAAPLLVLARPTGAYLWAWPASWRRGLGAFAGQPILAALWPALTDPLIATVLHGIALWLWHAPALFEAALTSEAVHVLQHVSFFVTALFFWQALLHGRARERGYGPAVFYLFATALHSGFLGILLALGRRPWYPLQAGAAQEWGLSPLEDQQLAGLVMWVPAGMIYTVAALALLALWIQRSGARAKGGENALAG